MFFKNHSTFPVNNNKFIFYILFFIFKQVKQFGRNQHHYLIDKFQFYSNKIKYSLRLNKSNSAKYRYSYKYSELEVPSFQAFAIIITLNINSIIIIIVFRAFNCKYSFKDSFITAIVNNTIIKEIITKKKK